MFSYKAFQKVFLFLLAQFLAFYTGQLAGRQMLVNDLREAEYMRGTMLSLAAGLDAERAQREKMDLLIGRVLVAIEARFAPFIDNEPKPVKPRKKPDTSI